MPTRNELIFMLITGWQGGASCHGSPHCFGFQRGSMDTRGPFDTTFDEMWHFTTPGQKTSVDVTNDFTQAVSGMLCIRRTQDGSNNRSFHFLIDRPNKRGRISRRVFTGCSITLKLAVQGLAVEAQHPCGECLVPTDRLQNMKNITLL